MAESSFLWDAAGGGDQSPHSEADVAAMFAAMAGGSGVFRGYLNELAPTVSGSNVLVDTGWAMVDGHPYRNSTSKSTAITVPVLGTTGHRIVLRCSWGATQTVRITDISSADNTAAIPAATTTSGTTYDVTLATLTITTGGVITLTDAREWAPGVLQNPYDLIRTQFRATRKLLGLFSALHYTSVDGAGSYASQPVGVGFTHGNSASSASSIGTLTNALLEGYVAGVTGATSTDAIGAVTGAASLVATTAPNKNPRMLIRWFPGSSNANLTSTFAGFMAGGTQPTATTAGAYLRANTTGNLFFVTRQGGSETTTDLGARPTTPTSYEIWTEDAGVTWYCRNDTTATVVATHTTNIPTATVALGHVIGGISASGSLNAHNTVFCSVESNTVA